MVEQRRFFEKIMNDVTSRLDKIQKELRDLGAHNRSLRDVQLKMKEDVSAIRAELKDLKKVPTERSFPIKEADDVANICRKFSDTRTTELVKKELGYALTNTSKDDWLRHIIRDDVVAKYHTAEEVRLLNFIQYIIRDITPTSDKVFTSLVSQAKNRVYARVYRRKKKESASTPAQKLREEAKVEVIYDEEALEEEEEEVEKLESDDGKEEDDDDGMEEQGETSFPE